MTPKARPDIQMNLPALQKLDAMLIVSGLFYYKNRWLFFLVLTKLTTVFYVLSSTDRKPWIQWLILSFGTLKLEAELKGEVGVQDRAKGGGCLHLRYQ